MQRFPVSSLAHRYTADDLADLLERSAQDEQAFAALYEATAARAHGLASRVLRDSAMAEEVVQEAYLDVWRLSHRYDRANGSVMAWLLTLVHRRAVDRVRSAQASAGRTDTYLRRAMAGGDVDTTSVSALASLEVRQVQDALTVLTPPQRHAISLAYFEGLTYLEVAEVVGAPVGTVKSRIRGGLLRLRRALEPAEPRAA